MPTTAHYIVSILMIQSDNIAQKHSLTKIKLKLLF